MEYYLVPKRKDLSNHEKKHEGILNAYYGVKKVVLKRLHIV